MGYNRIRNHVNSFLYTVSNIVIPKDIRTVVHISTMMGLPVYRFEYFRYRPLIRSTVLHSVANEIVSPSLARLVTGIHKNENIAVKTWYKSN